MNFLPLLLSSRKILFNPIFLLGTALVVTLTYYHFKVTSLTKDLEISKANTIKIQDINSNNLNTIKELRGQIKDINLQTTVLSDSYSSEIKKLKSLLSNIEKKVIYKDKIIIKKVKIPVIKEGKTIYINKCPEIKIHKLDNNETGILRTLSEVGK